MSMTNSENMNIHHQHAKAILDTLSSWTLRFPKSDLPLIDTIRALEISVSKAQSVDDLAALCMIRTTVQDQIVRKIGELRYHQKPATGWKIIGKQLGLTESGALKHYRDSALKTANIAPKPPAK
jgi:hypothetical protein